MNSVGEDDLGSLSCLYLMNAEVLDVQCHIWFYVMLGFWIPNDIVRSQGEVTVWGKVLRLKWSEEHPWALAQVAPLLSSWVVMFEVPCEHHLGGPCVPL